MCLRTKIEGFIQSKTKNELKSCVFNVICETVHTVNQTQKES